MAKQVIEESGRSTIVLSFLIADVRGYTRFTAERGDAAAALLAKRFADLARDAVEARGGRVIELRGDEALAVFESPSQAVRAAIEFRPHAPRRARLIPRSRSRSGSASTRAKRCPWRTGTEALP